MAEWYVLQTKVRHEAIAKENLANQAFNTFLPMMPKQRHRRGRWQSVREPLFPGYIFIELDLQSQNTATLRSTRGVISLVRCGLVPQPFPGQLMHGLMKAQELTVDTKDPSSIFECGDEVELISGPMAGLKGIFNAKSSMERVILLLDILGAQTRVSVSPHRVAKVG